MKRWLCFLAMVLCLALASRSGDADESDRPLDPRALIEGMLRAEENVEFAGQQTTVLRVNGKEETSRQWVKRARPYRVRIEYLSPPRVAGSIYVDDGKKGVYVLPGAQIDEAAPFFQTWNRRRFRREAAQLLRRNVSIQWVGTERIAGRKAHIVEVRPARRQFPRKKLWIDVLTGVRLKTEEFGPRGGYISTYFTRINYRPAFKPGDFLPPGRALAPGKRPLKGPGQPVRLTLEEARSLALRKGHRLLEPSYLPRGYEFKGAFTRKLPGREVIGLRYTDGLTPVSLFETPASSPTPDLPPRFRSGISWKRDEVDCVLIGSLSKDELQRIADSVR